MVWYWAGPDAIGDAAQGSCGGDRRRGQGCGAGQARRGQSRRRQAVPAGRARLRRRHGRAHQRGHRRPRRRHHDRQAHRLRQGSAAAALADHDDDRRLAAVGGLVRLQRRLQPRSQRHDGAGLRQHLRRHRGRAFSWLFVEWARQGQALAARHDLGRRRRPRRRDPGLRLRRPDGLAGSRPARLAAVPVLRLHGEEQVRL